MAFTDDFNRADGSLGSNWSSYYLSTSIVGNALVGAANAAARCLAYTVSGDFEATIVLKSANGSSTAGAFQIGANAGEAGFYYFTFNGDTSHQYLTLIHYQSGVATNVAYGNLTGSISFPWTILVRRVGTHYHVTLNGATWFDGEATLSHTGTDVVLQIGPTPHPFDSFSISDYTASTMVVTPNPVWIGGGSVQLTATASGTTWTIGVPGSSVITVDHGEIVGQYTIDSTHINFTLIPGLWVGAIVFTESQHGMTASIDVTITPPATAPWGLTLSPTAIAYIERSAVAETNPTIANRQMVVGGGGGAMPLLDGLADLRSSVDDSTYSPSGSPGANRTAWLLWRILNGVNSPPRIPLTTPSDTTLKEDADALKASFSTLTTSNHWTLGDVITQITGLGVPTIKDVLDALDGLAAPDLSGLSSQLAAIRGDSTTSLATLLSSLAGIRTTDAYSLDDVKRWIGHPAQEKPDATLLAVGAFLLALLAAPETGGASVAALAVAEGAGPLLDIATLVEAVALAGDVAGIIADIVEMKASLAAQYQGAPVWPGAAGRTLLPSHALADELVIAGPLHGVIVTITGSPRGAGYYDFGGTRSWQHVGAVAFGDDDGHFERPDSLGLVSQVICPRTLAVAQTATFRVNAGWTGTARGWTINP